MAQAKPCAGFFCSKVDVNSGLGNNLRHGESLITVLENVGLSASVRLHVLDIACTAAPFLCDIMKLIIVAAFRTGPWLHSQFDLPKSQPPPPEQNDNTLKQLLNIVLENKLGTYFETMMSTHQFNTTCLNKSWNIQLKRHEQQMKRRRKHVLETWCWQKVCWGMCFNKLVDTCDWSMFFPHAICKTRKVWRQTRRRGEKGNRSRQHTEACKDWAQINNDMITLWSRLHSPNRFHH